MEQKEATLDKKTEAFERKEEELSKKLQKANETVAQAEELKKQQQETLERISELTQEEAKQYLLKSVEDEVRHESAMKIKEIEQQMKDEAEEKGREIIATAIQRCAADHAAETTVSVVALPSDEMKGRIIGREGRNIRTLETITGVDLIIDDTPEAITVSSFDPVRREIARLALEKLIADGRIHPTRIEDMVEKARKEVDRTIREEGERACYETGVHNLNPELVKILGRQKYRTSYGQNVLNHSIEVAHIAGLMAAELGVDITLAKRGRTAPRPGQVHRPRGGGQPRAAGRGSGPEVQGKSGGGQRHRSPPRGCGTQDRHRRAGSGCRRRVCRPSPVPVGRMWRTMSAGCRSWRSSPVPTLVWTRLTPSRPAGRSGSWSSPRLCPRTT